MFSLHSEAIAYSEKDALSLCPLMGVMDGLLNSLRTVLSFYDGLQPALP